MNQQVMLSATEAQQKTKEPVTVQLQFEQYQMELIEVSAKLEGKTTTEFMHDYFLDGFISHLETIASYDTREVTKKIRENL